MENNVYALYLPERTTLRPGEHKISWYENLYYITTKHSRNLYSITITRKWKTSPQKLFNYIKRIKRNKFKSTISVTLEYSFRIIKQKYYKHWNFQFLKKRPNQFFVLCNDAIEEFDTKCKTIDKQGNQNNSFHVTVTLNNCRNKRKIIVTTNTSASLI